MPALKAKAEAADQGNARAELNLGVMYELGQGVAKDYAEAYAYYNLAAQFYEEAAKLRDALEERMSPQQVAEAQKGTRELRALIKGP